MLKLLKKSILNSTLYASIIVVIFWYMLHLLLGDKLIPGPWQTAVTFVRLLGEDLLLHVGVSLFRIISAIGISVLIGVPAGLWLGLGKKADSVVSPIVYILYPLPKIAFLPIFMIIFGLGNLSKIVLIITVIIFQILLAARDGVKEIPEELFFSVRSLGLNQRQIYYELVLPAVLPRILSALRISTGISISVLFFGENFATAYGIGYFIMNSWSMVDYPDMFAGILALSIMGILIFKALDAIEKNLCPWIFLKSEE